MGKDFCCVLVGETRVSGLLVGDLIQVNVAVHWVGLEMTEPVIRFLSFKKGVYCLTCEVRQCHLVLPSGCLDGRRSFCQPFICI